MVSLDARRICLIIFLFPHTFLLLLSLITLYRQHQDHKLSPASDEPSNKKRMWRAQCTIGCVSIVISIFASIFADPGPPFTQEIIRDSAISGYAVPLIWIAKDIIYSCVASLREMSGARMSFYAYPGLIVSKALTFLIFALWTILPFALNNFNARWYISLCQAFDFLTFGLSTGVVIVLVLFKYTCCRQKVQDALPQKEIEKGQQVILKFRSVLVAWFFCFISIVVYFSVFFGLAKVPSKVAVPMGSENGQVSFHISGVIVFLLGAMFGSTFVIAFLWIPRKHTEEAEMQYDYQIQMEAEK